MTASRIVRVWLLVLVGLLVAGEARGEHHKPSSPETNDQTYLTISIDKPVPWWQRIEPEDLVFTPDDYEFQVVASDEGIYAYADKQPEGEHIEVEIEMPEGERLEAREYPFARGDGQNDQPRLRIDRLDGKASCGSGRIDVRELTRDAEGEIESVHVLFEADCHQEFTGELYVNPDPQPIRVIPSANRFPERYPGETGQYESFPVRNFGPIPVEIAAASIRGADAEHFELGNDACTGTTLEPGVACTIDARFSPRARGPRTAELVIDAVGGVSARSSLEGMATPEMTRIQVDNEPDDPDRPWLKDADSSPGDRDVIAVEDASLRNGFRLLWSSFSEDGGGGLRHDDEIDVGVGRVLAPGRYEIPQPPPSGPIDEGAPSGSLPGCTQLRWFDVDSVDFSGANLDSLDLTWRAECDSYSTDGRLRWQLPIGDPPPPVEGLQVVRLADRAIVTWLPELLDGERERTILRFAQGTDAPRTVEGGTVAYNGTDSRAIIEGLDPLEPLAVSAFAVDADGNSSRRAAETVPPEPLATRTSAWIAFGGYGGGMLSTEPLSRFVPHRTPSWYQEQRWWLEVIGGVEYRLDGGSNQLGTAALRTEPPPPGAYWFSDDEEWIESEGDRTVHSPGCVRPYLRGMVDGAVGTGGELERLWTLDRAVCPHDESSSTEISWGVPAGPGPLTTMPAKLGFADQYPNALSTKPVPVTVRNDGDRQIRPAAAQVVGSQAGDFVIRNDACRGRLLAPGETCEVSIESAPSGPGPRHAELVVRPSGLSAPLDAPARTSLEGFGVREKVSFEYETYRPSTGEVLERRRFDASNARFGAPWTSDIDFAHRMNLPGGGVEQPSISRYTGTTQNPPIEVRTYPIRDPDDRVPGTMSAPAYPPCKSSPTGSFDVERYEFAPGYGNQKAERVEFSFEIRCEDRSEDVAMRGSYGFGVPGDGPEPPAKAGELKVVRAGTEAVVTWADPPSDHERTIVSYLPGDDPPQLPELGIRAYEGTGERAVISGLEPGREIAVSVFTVDSSGYYQRPAADPPIFAYPEEVDPAGPSSDSRIAVRGFAQPESEVLLFTDENCQGVPAAVGNGADFAGEGVEVEVPEDARTEIRVRSRMPGSARASSCSESVSYLEDSTPPVDDPHISFSPGGPANWNTPQIYFSAREPESGGSPITKVELFSNPTCAGTPISRQGSSEWRITVPNDSETTVRARVTDAAGNVMPCSTTSATYVEDSSAPEAPVLTRVEPGERGPDPYVSLVGTAGDDATEVRLYETSDCTGIWTGSATASSFEREGVAAYVGSGQTRDFSVRALDAAGNASNCSNSLSYRNTSGSPLEPPALERVDPEGPSSETRPRLVGSAPEGSEVRVYAEADCRDDLGGGTAADFESGGIYFSATLNSTTRIYLASKLDGRMSECTDTGVGYEHDSLAPDTAIELGAAKRRFLVSSDEEDVRFECRLDRRRWEPCTARTRLPLARPGRHEFSARAIDVAGNADASPAKLRFRSRGRNAGRD